MAIEENKKTLLPGCSCY